MLRVGAGAMFLRCLFFFITSNPLALRILPCATLEGARVQWLPVVLVVSFIMDVSGVIGCKADRTSKTCTGKHQPQPQCVWKMRRGTSSKKRTCESERSKFLTKKTTRKQHRIEEHLQQSWTTAETENIERWNMDLEGGTETKNGNISSKETVKTQKQRRTR